MKQDVFRSWTRMIGVSPLLCLLLWVVEVRSQEQVQVGYATLTPAPGSPLPVASALFSFRNGDGVLVSEAGVAAVEPIQSGRLFVDGSIPTGLALANPSDTEITADLVLRDANGAVVDQSEVTLPDHQHFARFVQELFGTLDPDFRGSLTFRAPEGQALAALTIRQGTNAHNEPLFATLPVAEIDESIQTAVRQSGLVEPTRIIFPHIGAGGIITTQIILINPTAETIVGRIDLTGSDGLPLTLLLDGTPGSQFDFELPPDGVFEGLLTSADGISAGYATVTVDEGNTLPAGTAIFQFRDGSNQLVSEAGVAAALTTTRARIFVDTDGTQTGVALASPENNSGMITFRLLDGSGQEMATESRLLPENGHLSLFAEDLFGALPAAFAGILEIQSEIPFAPVTLKLTVNARGDLILTTLPVADLDRPPAATSLIFPQIGFGQGFSTRLILINPDLGATASGELRFVGSLGQPIEVPLTQFASDTFRYELASGAAAQDVTPVLPVADIQLDSSEVAVTVGNTVKIAPSIVDAGGQIKPDTTVSFSSLDEAVATVDSDGNITGHQRGFSTLTMEADGVVSTATISVVDVTAGVGGFGVDGLAQSQSGRLFLASRSRQAILEAESLVEMPTTYAGMENSPGLRDDSRLASLFRAPSSLAINQANGLLYVADRGNHAIRLISPGGEGRVETLAGTGSLGAEDGTLSEASFRLPSGVALDERGRLWVADSGNHTIRRIDLVTGMVQTVAGLAGSRGLQDGTGSEARFDSPTSLAIERESLAERLLRESIGAPPPPVSVIVADSSNDRLRRVFENGEVETIGGATGAASPAGIVPGLPFADPSGVAVDSTGTIYVAKTNGDIEAVLPSGEVVDVVEPGTLSTPGQIAVTEAGRVVVADGNRTGQEITYGTPLINLIEPDTVLPGGGTNVTIRGRNFSPDSIIVVAGRVVQNLEVANTGELTFVSPPLESGLTTVSVQNRGGVGQSPLYVSGIPFSSLEPGEITTLAGGSTFIGDGGRRESAVVEEPHDAVIDSAGNLFIADYGHHRVRRIDAQTGITTTYAGTGEAGFSGDGGPAIASALSRPFALALDSSGNLYITDQGNHRVRVVEAATGLIRTIAEVYSAAAITLDHQGNLYASSIDAIYRVEIANGNLEAVVGMGDGGFSGTNGFSGDGGPAVEAQVRQPEGLALDSEGNLYLADTFNDRIRRVDRESGIIETIAGSGMSCSHGGCGLAEQPALASGLGKPSKMTFLEGGDLLFADTQNNVLRVIDAETQIISVVTGDPTGNAVNQPRGFAVDGEGNILIADSRRHRILLSDGQTQELETFAGTGELSVLGDGGPATAASLDFPASAVSDSNGNIFIADKEASRIRIVEAGTGIISTYAGSGVCPPLCPFSDPPDGDGGAADLARVHTPDRVALDPDGNLLIAAENRIRRVDRNTGIITTIAGLAQPPPSQFDTGDGGPALEAGFAGRLAVTSDLDGNLFIAQFDFNNIRRVDAVTGTVTRVAGTGDYDLSGDGGPAVDATMRRPTDLTVDRFGNIYFSDRENHRVRKIDPDGIMSTVAGIGVGNTLRGFAGDGGPAVEARLFFPEGVGVDADGNLFIADTYNHRIRRVDAQSGIITTVAGSGFADASGDGGPALEAGLRNPWDVFIDADGNLLIADWSNDRIRIVKAP